MLISELGHPQAALRKPSIGMGRALAARRQCLGSLAMPGSGGGGLRPFFCLWLEIFAAWIWLDRGPMPPSSGEACTVSFLILVSKRTQPSRLTGMWLVPP